jgi:hypothetical protein
VAGPGCVDFLGAASWRRRHGKPIRRSVARASRFLGDPRVKIGPVEVDRSIAGRPRFLDTRRHISARARKDVFCLSLVRASKILISTARSDSGAGFPWRYLTRFSGTSKRGFSPSKFPARVSVRTAPVGWRGSWSHRQRPRLRGIVLRL